MISIVSILSLISNSSSFVSKLYEQFQAHLLISPSSTYFTFFGGEGLWQGPSIRLSFRFLLFSLCGLPEWYNSQYGEFIITIIIYSSEFFTSALADGLSLEFEWQQVFSSLQDSSQYSGRLDSLQLLLSLFFSPWEFFTPALADGLSFEFEWQQVSSSLQDYFQNSGRSQ